MVPLRKLPPPLHAQFQSSSSVWETSAALQWPKQSSAPSQLQISALVRFLPAVQEPIVRKYLGESGCGLAGSMLTPNSL